MKTVYGNCIHAAKCKEKTCVHRIKHEIGYSCKPSYCEEAEKTVFCTKLENESIQIWRYDEAPDRLKKHRAVETGKEDFIVFIPASLTGQNLSILNTSQEYQYDTYTTQDKGIILIRSLVPEKIDW